MTAQIIYADFRSKTYHKPETLEQMAVEIVAQFDTAPCEMIPYHGHGIDGMLPGIPGIDPEAS
jgi:hypothetical protein